jgi:hypothetical protein
MMTEGIDYCFIYPKEEADITHIKLLQGPYKDTVFKYGKVSFKEDQDQIRLLFAYYVLESPVMKPKKLESDPDFKQYAGDLLVELMTSNLDEDIIDETRTDDPEESDLQ